MADLQRTFLAGRMNKDLDERLIPDGEYRDAVNITIDTSEGSSVGAVQNAFGNTQLNIPQSILASMGITISNDLSTIGAVTYEAQSLLYWFVVGSDFEGIFEYNQETQITSLILGCTDGQLGFTKNNLITGVNYITDGKGSGLLVWNDNKNEPRKINISRARTYSVDDPRIDIDINLIVKPPLNTPYIKLSTLASPNLIPNNIEDKFVYFSYRYKYADNEYSSMSPFSAVAFDPKALQVDNQTGENKGMLNKFNQVELSFETGNEFVKEIQLLVWESRTLNVRIIDNLDKSELNIPDNAVESFYFMNNKTYAALPSDQTTRLFDNVPLKALAQDVIGSRLVMGNYVQFRDLVNSAGMIDINYVVDYIPEPVTVDPKQTWRSDRDYEIGIAYLDDYGRMTTVLTTSSDNTNNNQSNSVYIPAENSDTANSLVVTIKNKAPEWATGYRFFVKQSKGEYYNLFPSTYVIDGSYRYFLINESDRDKIKVNGYIIFKSSGAGPTNSNKRFKVLELDYKAAGFQGISGALEGLYFKIKADASDTFISSTNQISYNFSGSGRGPRILTLGSNTVDPVTLRTTALSSVARTLAYYHSSGDNTIQNTGPSVDLFDINCQTDARLTILITPGNKYKTTLTLDQSTFSAESNITTIPTSITIATGQTALLVFQSGTYNPGDRFVFNIRGKGSKAGTPSARNNPNFGLPIGINSFGLNEYGGVALLKEPSSIEIFPSAQIVIEIEYDCAPGDGYRSTGPQTFISPNYYINLEEWFYESGAYLSFIQWKDQASTNNIGSKGISFRNGTDYLNSGNPSSNTINQTPFQVANSNLYMCIQGFGNGSLPSQKNEIKSSLKVTQTPLSNRVTAETVPSNDDTDIYYELSRTHKIENGNHLSLWRYDASTVIGLNSKLTQNGNKEPHYFEAGQTVYITASNIPAGTPFTVVSAPDRYSILINYVVPSNQSGGVSNNDFDQDQTSALNPAVVVLNNPTNKNSDYNAYCYGNGVESNRILDTYNEPWLKYSLRASTVIEDYEQQVKDASLTYSGLYQWSSSINRLNEFNLSTANFKNLDKNFGSIQKIYARTTDLLVLHQNKITSVLYGKNLLVDAVGGGTVASVPEVLGTQIAYPYEFGISSNPESFAVWGDTMYFADSKRGAVLKMTNDQVLEVSRVGMSDYFRDLMKANPQNAKLGAYDPYNHNYVIASTTIRNTPCDITINPTVGSVANNTAGSLEYMFSISGTTSWFIELISIGFGTSWIELPPYCQTGVGSQDIYARVQNNLATGPRSVAFRVRYCSSYVDYILTQGIDKKIDFNILTFGQNE
jgi:hypothetical protein